MDKTVGIVGLGIMGSAIARNLVDRAWRVIGNRAHQSQEMIGKNNIHCIIGLLAAFEALAVAD